VELDPLERKSFGLLVAKMLEGIEGDEKEAEVESSFQPLIHGG
jgi:hypothetical protein